MLAGPVNLTGLNERKRAVDDGDEDALRVVFGRRTPPHDVPVPSKQPAPGFQVIADNITEDATLQENASGGPNEDTHQGEEHSHPLTVDDFPPLPPLPPAAGFVPTA